MERRAFVKNTSLAAAAIAVFGSIKWANGKPIGDSPTTTDILGPYYRPGAPIRSNINPEGFTGVPLHMSGTIFKDDGKTYRNSFAKTSRRFYGQNRRTCKKKVLCVNAKNKIKDFW